MTSNRQPVAVSAVVLMAAGAITIGALYFAQDVLIPLALAVLFSFLLAPLVHRLERYYLGRIPSAVLVVLLSSGVMVGIGYVVTTQLVSLTYKLPEYRDNIRHKIHALRGQTDLRLARVTDTIKEIRQELTTQPATSSAPVAEVVPARLEDTIALEPGRSSLRPTPVTAATPAHIDSARPVPVEVVEESSIWETTRKMIVSVAGPIGQAGVVFVLVLFMLIQREDVRDRFISLMGRGRINITTIAIDDAAQRISRYLLMQLLVNAAYGIPVGIGLYLIGVPNALLWGMLGTLLRYLPYIGPLISAALPTALALAVFDDWRHVGMVVGLFVVLELIINNAIEPFLYGSSTGLSTVAILVSALFWTWLWGPVGLFLSTPMTACIAVMGKYIPHLEFLSVLLGDQPVFDAVTRFYQRLVAMDQEEAEDLMEEYLEKGTLLQAYDQFLLPALHLAEQDFHRGRLDPQRYEFLIGTIRTMVAELGEEKIESERKQVIEEMRVSAENIVQPPQKPSTVITEPRAPHLLPEGFSILCVPARDDADEVAARMFGQVLQAKGFQVEVVTTSHLKSEVLEAIRASSHQVVCVSSIPPGGMTQIRYLCKRLHLVRDVQAIVGVWNSHAKVEDIQKRLVCGENTHVVRTFADALERVRLVAHRQISHAPSTDIPTVSVN